MSERIDKKGDAQEILAYVKGNWQMRDNNRRGKSFSQNNF